MKKIIIIGASLLLVILSLNANAEITSECTLKGNGDYQCNFDNKGKKKDRTCVRMMLGVKSEVLGQATMFATNIAGRMGYQAMMRIGDSAAIGEEVAEIDAIYRQFLSEHKKLAAASKKTLDAYIKANMESLLDQILRSEHKGLSSEVCSGIVEPNDLRERHGTVGFSGGIADNLSPMEACKTDDESATTWQDICSFSPISPIELHNYVKNKIKLAPTSTSGEVEAQ